MRWWPFGRAPAGRHALGAAVTSIPSGPLVVPVQLPAPVVAPAPAAVPELDLDGLLSLLGDRVAQEAAEEPVPAPAPAQAPEPATGAVALPGGETEVGATTHRRAAAETSEPAGDVHAPEPPVAEPPVVELPVPELPVVVVPVQAPPPFVPPGPPALSPELLEALDALVTPAPPAPRVQLGFRDGSTAALEPSSAQARALEDLARALTSG